MINEAKYVLIPDSVIENVYVNSDYSWDLVRKNAWMRCPKSYSGGDLPIESLRGQYEQGRQCEFGTEFVLRQLNGVNVPYHYLVQKGGGPSGFLAGSEVLRQGLLHKDPIGYFGYEDAVKEKDVSERLLSLGLPSCVVVGIIKLAPEKLIDYMSTIWQSEKEVKDYIIKQIQKIQSNGHSPALLHRHVGINCRIDDPYNSEIVRMRLQEVFEAWLNKDPISFKELFGDYNVIHYTQVRSLYRIYLDSCIRAFYTRDKVVQAFPSSSDDTDVLGMGADYEMYKKGVDLEYLKTKFESIYQSL